MNSELKVGDKVIINDFLQLNYEDEEKMINQKAEVVEITDFVYPVKIKFLNPDVENINYYLGGRMFDYFELTKI